MSTRGGWLGSYGGEDCPSDISAGCSPARSARPRLLELFRRWGIKTSWFIPGHSIETFPAEMKAVADAGHEIGTHGYTHENPIAMTPAQEEAIFDKCIEVIEALQREEAARLCRPVGGVRLQDQRAAAEERDQVRPHSDA